MLVKIYELAHDEAVIGWEGAGVIGVVDDWEHGYLLWFCIIK